MQLCFPGYLDHIGLVKILLARHKNDNSYVLKLAALVHHAKEVKRLMGLDASCLDLPYDRYHSTHDADAWFWELHFQ